MTTKRGQISRIDILQATVQVDEEGADYIAKQLGLAPVTEALAQTIILDAPISSIKIGQPTIRLSASQKRLKSTDRPKTYFWYLHRREPSKPLNDKPLMPVAIEWQNRPQQAAQHQPLASKKALLAKLQMGLHSLQNSHKVDVAKVVRIMSQAEHLQRLPKQAVKNNPMHLHLIDDRSRHLTPYWQDHHHASAVIYQHYTQVILSLSVSHEDSKRPQQITATGFGKWQVADHSKVIIFSDLGGLNSYPQRAVNQWLTLGRELQRKQCRVLVLLPYAVQQVDPRFKALFHCLSWEHAAMANRLDDSQKLPLQEKLLVALSPSIRIEPSLLRAMRLAMQVHGKAWQIPAVIESYVWQHEAIQEPHSVAASWAVNARQQYLQAFESLSNAEKTTALNTLRQWRATLSAKIWYEEIISLDAHSQQLTCIQQDVQQAKLYFDVLSERWQKKDSLAQAQPTQAWFRRLYQRLPKQRLQASSSLQRIAERVYKDVINFDSQWLNPQKLPPSSDDIQQADLYQHGNQLRLKRYQPFALPAYGYSHVALIKLRRKHVQVLTEDKVLGELRLDSSDGFTLPVEQQLTLMSDQETLMLQTEPYSDIAEMGRDVYGLYADLDLLGVIQRFRYIEAGTFMMGSPYEEVERENDESYHQVILSKSYWLADTACVQALWQAVMRGNPAGFNDNLQNPVENVSWLEVQAFLKKLNQYLPHLQAQLPSEAQWEYACRAGTTTPFSFGENIMPEQVNYNGTRPYDKGEKGEDRQKTLPVKALPANQWGLYQMHGNIWEWCLDEWQSNLGISSVFNPVNAGVKSGANYSVDHVLRGGSWLDDGRYCRSAIRGISVADYRNRRSGFRFSLGYELQPVQVGSRFIHKAKKIASKLMNKK